MSLTLYDLCTAEPALRPSPFCWTAKLGLLHKQLKFETEPVPFANKTLYPDPKWGKAPILIDNGEIIPDSPVILAHLDRKYLDRPLAATHAERAAVEFYRAFLGAHVFPALRPFMLMKVLRLLEGADADYFRKSREAAIGATLEAAEQKGGDTKGIESAIAIISAPLASRPFFSGDAPALADYVIAGPFLWQRTVTTETFYEPPPAFAQWFERMLDLFDGYARNAPRAP